MSARAIRLGSVFAVALLCGCRQHILVPPEPGVIPDDVIARTFDEAKFDGEDVYRVGIGDGVAIQVVNFPDFSVGSSVRPDGRITVPLVGDVEILDLTASEISEKVKLRLQDYIKQDLLITTTVSGFRSLRYFAFGEVGRPGPTVYGGRVSLIDAVSQVGYNPIRSNLARVILYRNGKRVIMPHRRNPWWRGGGIKDSYNVEQIMRLGLMQDNIVVKPDDIVYVPRNWTAWLSDQIDEMLLPVTTAMRITSQAYNLSGFLDSVGFGNSNNSNNNNNN